jgi:hypothetical protein
VRARVASLAQLVTLGSARCSWLALHAHTEHAQRDDDDDNDTATHDETARVRRVVLVARVRTLSSGLALCDDSALLAVSFAAPCVAVCGALVMLTDWYVTRACNVFVRAIGDVLHFAQRLAQSHVILKYVRVTMRVLA